MLAEPLLRIEGLTKRYPGVDRARRPDVRRCRAAASASSAPTAPARRRCSGCCSGSPTRREGRIEVCGIDVARDPIGVRVAPRLHARARLPAARSDRGRRRVDVRRAERAAGRVPPASGPPTSSTSSASTRRASARSAGSRPGMRQRTKLAQALVGDPELVLLDEPTAGLDPLGREEMLALVARLGTFGISVLMATHLLDDVQQVCDHVVMIDAGRLVVSGATDSLLERTGMVTVDVGPRRRRARRRARRRRPAGDRPTTASSRSTVDGDAQLDALRDVIADLGLPLYRLSTRLTSLDDVFLRRAGSAVMSVVDAGTRRRLRPRLPAVRGRRAAGAGRRRSRCTRRRSAGRSGSAVRGARRSRRSCCSASSRSRRSSTSASATSPATSARRPHRDHHLPRLRRRVVGAAAVRRARRSRRDVPRSASARAAADVRPPADRRRLRRRQGRRDRDDPVRVLVPAAGGAVRRQHARQRQRRSTTSPATSTSCGRCRSPCSCWRSTTR